MNGMGMGQSSAPTDSPVVDTAEQVYISSLALLKMLKHGRAGNFISLIIHKRVENVPLKNVRILGVLGNFSRGGRW